MSNALVITILLGLFFVAGTLHLDVAEAKESCVNEKCHGKMGKEKYVHGPVAVGDCLVCHTKIGQHKFAPVKAEEKLCYKCHPDRADASKGIHRQVKDNCSKCHDPHQSPYKYQLRKEKM